MISQRSAPLPIPSGPTTITFNTKEETTYHYTPVEDLFKSVKFNDTEYTFVPGVIGKGKYNTTYRFTPFNGMGSDIAVKIQRCDTPDLKKNYNRRKDNIKYSKIAQPHLDQTLFKLEHVKIPGYTVLETIITIEPFIEGESLKSYLIKYNTPDELRKVFLAIAEEIKRNHALGVIHGDIKEDNMRIHRDPATGNVRATLIDYDCAYLITDKHAVRTAATTETMGENCHWPPERTGDCKEDTAPAFNQDTFAFGVLLEYAKRRTNPLPFPRSLMGICRSIRSAEKPEKRTPMKDIIALIKAELRPLSPRTTTAKLIQDGIKHAQALVSKNDLPVSMPDPTPMSISSRTNSISSFGFTTSSPISIPSSKTSTSSPKRSSYSKGTPNNSPGQHISQKLLSFLPPKITRNSTNDSDSNNTQNEFKQK